MDLDPFRHFAALKDEYAGLERKKKDVKAEMDNLQEALIDVLLSEGMAKVPIDVEGVGSVLLYPRTTLWAGPKDGNTPALIDALKSSGMGDIVKETVNRQTLSGIVRESRKEDSDALPPLVELAIDTYEKTELAMRKQ